jgi:hypothetical protein
MSKSKKQNKSKTLTRKQILNAPDAPKGQRACDFPEKDKELAERILKVRELIYQSAKNLIGNDRLSEYPAFLERALWVSAVTGLDIKDFNQLNIKEQIQAIQTAAKIRKSKQKQDTGAEKPPLTEIAGLIYEKLKSLPEHKAMKAPDIADWLSKEHNTTLDETTIRKNHLKKIEPYGLKNKPKVGYYIRKS